MTFKPCELDAKQVRLWEETRTALVWNCPAFTHIFYTLLNNAGSKHIALFTKDVPIAATDGSNLLLNPDTFFKYSLKERVFIVAHEIMHCIWNHIILMHGFQRRGKVAFPDGTSLPYDQMLMNIATDLVINDTLIESNIGKFNTDWLHDPKIATSADSALDAYRKVYKQSGGGKGAGPSGNGFDEHLAPGAAKGKDPGTAAAERNDSQWRTEIAAASNIARARGQLPAGLDRLFKEILDPQVDWRDKIQSLFARKVGSGSYNWTRPDRSFMERGIYAPSRSGFGAGTVVVGIDTSGSIGDRELDMFFAEMSGILEDVRPQRIVVIWCDATVNRVDEIEDAMDLTALRKKGAPGGGGTAFEPVFNEIHKMGLEPDALVYLTDGYGSFPKAAPSYPVIWGSISPPDAVKYPFGDIVDVPKQAA